VDAVPIVGVTPREDDENDEDEVEIDLVEDMTSIAPLPAAGHQAGIASHTNSQSSEHINHDGDDIQTTRSLKPIAAPQFSPAPLPEVGSKAKEPLFLPSSTSSSPNSRQTPNFPYLDDDALGADNLDPATVMDTHMKGLDTAVETLPASKPTKKKRLEVFVLVPPPPDWVKRAKLNVRSAENFGKKRKGSLEAGTVEELDDEIEQWTEISATEDEDAEKRRQDEIVEQATMSLTMSLLREQPCKWRNCNAVMNSVDSLSRHLALHAQEKPLVGSFVCLWQNCLRRFMQEGKLLAHMETHARSSVPCPFQGCDDDYKTAKDLFEHCLLEHKDDAYRPTPIPFQAERMELPEVPATVPSYMVIPRDIRQAPISAGRHALVGPWVSALVILTRALTNYLTRCCETFLDLLVWKSKGRMLLFPFGVYVVRWTERTPTLKILGTMSMIS
jgi:hypothetical protein